MTERGPWTLAVPCSGVRLEAGDDGMWLRGDSVDVTNPAQLRSTKPSTRLGQLLPTLVPQLVELGVAIADGGAIRILYEEFVTLEAREIDAFDDVAPWSPFTLQLGATGWLGGSTFAYTVRFFLGTQAVAVRRLGAFVRRGEAIYRLDGQTYALLEAIERFNALAPDARCGPDSFIRFAEVKGLATGVGVQLDKYIATEQVFVPPRVGLNLVVEPQGRISFAPTVDGVNDEQMRSAFFAQPDVDEMYSFDDGRGGRIRVVMDDAQREVLRRMQGVRHLSGVEKAEVLRNPVAVFDGVADAVDLNLEAFGPRVRGIGDFPFVAQPYIRRGTGIFDGPEAGPLGTGTPFSAGIQCGYADGHSEDLTFTSKEEVIEFCRAVEAARTSGEGAVEFRGKSIILDDAFVGALAELREQVIPPSRPKVPTEKKRRRFLLIYTNENELEYEEQPETTAAAEGVLPAALRAGIDLKPHQRQGLAWLQRCFTMGRHGCLLADDMGMGKTVQILTFVAWLIEQGELSPDGTDPSTPPWDPILIVAPLVLIENETWVSEMRAFFAEDGATFQPVTVLRGEELKRLRRADAGGGETDIGAAVLDLDRLREHRVILTNYETVTNYQHSFAQMRTHWSVVITDEAQEFKVPNTKISHALKSLSPRFRIAATGTPVETRLLDVWNLFDFLQPGTLLGSAAEFSRQYEREADDGAGGSLDALKGRLRFGSSDAYVLRRDKSQLTDLPPKIEHDLHCDLSPEQRQWHIDLLRKVRAGGEGSHPLGIIHHLLRLYQHPALVPKYEPVPVAAALASCPKLAAVIECVRQVRARGEKALIFTRSLDMQQLLSRVLAEEFGLEADIINGAAPRGDKGGRGKRSRSEMVRRFRSIPGFNAIILSPDVAGVGLTLTEANHVIHYGRWWNPAKESQATDRAYRIGQTRDVHVYYPIALDPQREFETFDEKLHALVRRRRTLAAEFLAPMPSEDDLQDELLDDVLRPGKKVQPAPAPVASGVDLRSVSPDRLDALVAELEAGAGRKVILGPRGAAEGVQLIALEGNNVRLVNCMATTGDTQVGAETIAETARVFDGYRAHHLRGIGGTLRVVGVVVTRGTLGADARKVAKDRGLEVVAGPELQARLLTTPCTQAALELRNEERCGSTSDVVSALHRALGSGGQGAAVPAANPHDEWIEALLESSRYREQTRANERTALPEDRVREFLRAVAERSGRVTRVALAQRLGVSLPRVSGVVAAIRKVLNVEGYQVVAADEGSDTIALNMDLLRVQFELRGPRA